MYVLFINKLLTLWPKALSVAWIILTDTRALNFHRFNAAKSLGKTIHGANIFSNIGIHFISESNDDVIGLIQEIFDYRIFVVGLKCNADLIIFFQFH